MEQALSIIKPDAVMRNLIGRINTYFERADLHIVAMKMLHLRLEQAQTFYAIHQKQPFYHQLVTFMISGPVVVQVLEGQNAIAKNRELMGATDPKQAQPGTIRADLAEDISHNVIHGSDSAKTAIEEINYFFTPEEIYSRCTAQAT